MAEMKNQGLLEEEVLGVQDELPSAVDRGDFGSIILIASLLSILVNALRLMQICGQDKALTAAHRPNLRHRRQLNQLVRKEIGFKAYRRYGKATVDAIIARGQKTSHDRLNKLIEAAKE